MMPAVSQCAPRACSLASPESAVRAYAVAATRWMAPRFTVTRCVNGTRICIDVMERLGFSAVPVSVEAVAMNRECHDFIREHGHTPTRDESETAWAVAIDTRPEATDEANNGWGGHLVALVENQLLVDSAAIAFCRPEKGIHVPDIFVGAAADERNAARGFLCGERELRFATKSFRTHLVYVARPDDRSYEHVSGFQRHAGNREAAEAILRAMEAS